MSKTPTLTDAEAALFRATVGDVKRHNEDRVKPIQRRPAARPRQPLGRDVAASGTWDEAHLPDLLGEQLYEFRSGVQRSQQRKLSQGKIRPNGSLDLHGLRMLEAEQLLTEFLEAALAQQWRCVHIIHGKGRGSKGIPKLKAAVARALQLHPSVVGYCSAPAHAGGTGAVFVLLSGKAREK